MNTSTLTTLLQIAALLHLGLLCAGASMPKAVSLREHIGALPPFLRQLFLVYFCFSEPNPASVSAMKQK